jgi:alkylmercury lyase
MRSRAPQGGALPEANVSIDAIFDTLTAKLSDLNEAEQFVALALYRELLRGVPVSDNQIAQVQIRDVHDVSALLQAPGLDSMIYRDDNGLIVGFGGLAVVPMNHRFCVNGRTLYTWCAWDALFLVDVLDVRAEIESTCPQTGTAVHLTASRAGVERIEPNQAVLSFLLPDAPLFEQSTGQTITSFCHYIHFLASPQAAEQWTAKHEGTFALSVDDGFRLGQMNNDARFGAVLNRD